MPASDLNQAISQNRTGLYILDITNTGAASSTSGTTGTTGTTGSMASSGGMAGMSGNASVMSGTTGIAVSPGNLTGISGSHSLHGRSSQCGDCQRGLWNYRNVKHHEQRLWHSRWAVPGYKVATGITGTTTTYVSPAPGYVAPIPGY